MPELPGEKFKKYPSFFCCSSFMVILTLGALVLRPRDVRADLNLLLVVDFVFCGSGLATGISKINLTLIIYLQLLN